ncbi:hypothetical protein B5E53_18265 [Eubacterium sp. An11]|uniref:transposase n=1 Tax=Eubacterium sp. An11 TaxID=1965542 RepID=UPI000B37254D|nr:transposase [Eubacterium sp. An11]OUQ62103.1 hypothetical protein B5E53_18265 [Eubacterium sp. An11]
MSISRIAPVSDVVIYSEYGDLSNFSTPTQMLAFAGIEPNTNNIGTRLHRVAIIYIANKLVKNIYTLERKIGNRL